MAEIKITVPAVGQLLKYVASGVGAVGGSMLAPWRERQEAKAQIIRAGADAHSRMIEAEGDKIASLIATETVEAQTLLTSPESRSLRIAELVQMGIEFQGRKRYLNTEAVVQEAADELSDKEVPNQEPDHDWTARFFDGVKDVSSSEMRSIWARLLAGEVESPGRTSLRTLDVLRNMTLAEANMFADFCGFAFNTYGGGCVWWNYESTHIPFGILLRLEECGLVTAGVGFIVRTIPWKRQVDGEWCITLTYQGHYLIITKDPGAVTEDKLEIPVVDLTTQGKELFQFVQHAVPKEKYLRSFASFLKNEKGCQLFRLDDVESLPGGQIRFRNRVPITPSE